MANVEIYTWSTCPYCRKAKALLDSKAITYTEHDITGDEIARSKMAERTGGRRSVPQIFINGKSSGGCDDLHALEEQGRLDALLNG
jgi:glutaredoxin 3